MAVGDLPTMASSAYASTTIPLGQATTNTLVPNRNFTLRGDAEDYFIKAQRAKLQPFAGFDQTVNQILEDVKMSTPTRRMVQVLIVDPNENIPLKDCLLHEGKPHLTDATDQELFYELDIKTMLEKHNEKRIKLVDKKVKDRTEYLEPARVRDLKMVVVKIADF